MTWTRIHNIYLWIMNRCNWKYNEWCKNYWLRGIRCEWESFEDFYRDMGESYNNHVEEYGEKETTIDRIDANWNYCKENCRWATIKEQGNNTRTNVSVRYKWKKYPSIQLLCEDLGIKYNTLYRRVFIEWQDIENAIDELKTKAQKYKYKWVNYKGITDMCRQLWINRTSIAYRLKIGMSIEDAIEKEFRCYNK